MYFHKICQIFRRLAIHMSVDNKVICLCHLKKEIKSSAFNPF